jgi:cytochrome c-type biogenesis protein CcmF
VWFLALLFVVSASLIFYRWPELRDLPPSRRLRRAAVATGWLLIALYGPGLYAIYNLPISLGWRIGLMATGAGAFVFVGIELVFRRMTRGLALISKRPAMESFLSRELTFLLNNWGLLGFMLFVLVATTFPMISEAFWNEKVTVGPPYYNAWVQPIGLTIFALMGAGTLFGWKKTSPDALRRAYRVPLGALALAVTLHLAWGRALGFPPLVWSSAIYAGALGQGLRTFNAVTPLLGVSLAAFNLAVIVQEFALLFRSRRRSGANRETPGILWFAGVVPGLLYTLITLPPPSRRRYGGYIVHLGIVLAVIGFTGRSWDIDRETSLAPGETYQVENYSLEYVGPRMDVDNAKRMIFADVRVLKDGKYFGKVSPAKFIYKKSPESPTTEVSILHSIREDLYLIVGTINPSTKVATLQVHVNPLVSFIWVGCMVLICGSLVCMWPQLQEQDARAWAVGRRGAMAVGVVACLVIASWPVQLRAQTEQASSLHAGSVEMRNETERSLFGALRCMCGDCPRDLLSTCACSTAQEARETLRTKLARGESAAEIILEYQKEFGIEALSIPPNTGAMRAIYAVPLAAFVGGAVGLGFTVARWRSRPVRVLHAPTGRGMTAPPRDEFDARLDDELAELDD